MEKFQWNEENTAVITAAYLDQIAKDEGKADTANGNGFLTDLATKVGSPSARSVRQKLASAGVYIKAEAKATNGTTGTTGSTRQKKLILASLIADAIKAKDDSLGDANGDIFASLEHAGRPALLALLALLEGRPMGNEDLEA